jgi:predicted DNA-binding transcriptional regulator AlpA
LEDEDANYPISNRYRANGVFSLTEEDEIKYRHTGSLKGIDTLYSSNHSDSEFTKALGRGMFDAELTRLAEAAQFHLGSELVDLEEFHDVLERNALFYFDAHKEMPLALAKSDINSTTHKIKNIKKPVAKETAQTINTENPSFTVGNVAKKAPLESTSKTPEKVMTIRSDLIPAEGYLRLRQIIGDKEKGIPAIIPISKSTFYKRVKEGIYPQPVELGVRMIAWRVKDIRALIDKL